jgi:hypothetical protein
MYSLKADFGCVALENGGDVSIFSMDSSLASSVTGLLGLFFWYCGPQAFFLGGTGGHLLVPLCIPPISTSNVNQW